MGVGDSWALALEGVDSLKGAQRQSNETASHMADASENLARAVECLEGLIKYYQATAESMAEAISSAAKVSGALQTASGKFFDAGALESENEQVKALPMAVVTEAEYFENWATAAEVNRNRMQEMVGILMVMQSMDTGEHTTVVNDNLLCVNRFTEERNPAWTQLAEAWAQTIIS